MIPSLHCNDISYDDAAAAALSSSPFLSASANTNGLLSLDYSSFAEMKKKKDPKLLKTLEKKACDECNALAKKLREVTDEKTKEDARKLFLQAESYYLKTEVELTNSPKASSAWEKFKKRHGEGEAEEMAKQWEKDHRVSSYDAFVFSTEGEKSVVVEEKHEIAVCDGIIAFDPYG